MRAYSTDLREKIVMAYESGRGTLDEMASTFEVDRRTVSRLLHRYRTGEGLAPKPHGGGYPASLDDKRLGLLRRLVEREPDATLEELAAYLKSRAKVEVHPSTVCRALQRLELPRKKKSGGLGAGRSRPACFPSSGRAAGPPPLRLHRRDGLSPGDDEGLRAGGAGRAGPPERPAQPRPRCDFGRVSGSARTARAAELGGRTRYHGLRLLCPSRVGVAVAPLGHRAARQPAGACREPGRGGGRRGQGGGDVAASVLAGLLSDRGVLVEGQGAGARAPAAHTQGVGRGTR